MKEDFEKIRIVSHALTPSAAYFGSIGMYDLLSGLEAKGVRKESMNLIQKGYADFLHETRKVKGNSKRPVSLNIIDFGLFEKQTKSRSNLSGLQDL